ncbi:predicted protein [Streptomyces sp. SPB78]|uniref:hypothetical protein n=1 Tax=Streptomyces sp. (strain SPB78) TaxID=591157 RepID=UPI0001B56EA4|nr:hypothetical protein [Streptomyces sp. SPB78]EFL01613.1 predicted protein [Streptomyces sp. SPB78]
MSLHDAALVINGLCMGWLLALAVHLIAQDRADRRAEEQGRARYEAAAARLQAQLDARHGREGQS